MSLEPPSNVFPFTKPMSTLNKRQRCFLGGTEKEIQNVMTHQNHREHFKSIERKREALHLEFQRWLSQLQKVTLTPHDSTSLTEQLLRGDCEAQFDDMDILSLFVPPKKDPLYAESLTTDQQQLKTSKETVMYSKTGSDTLHQNALTPTLNSLVSSESLTSDVPCKTYLSCDFRHHQDSFSQSSISGISWNKLFSAEATTGCTAFSYQASVQGDLSSPQFSFNVQKPDKSYPSLTEIPHHSHLPASCRVNPDREKSFSSFGSLNEMALKEGLHPLHQDVNATKHSLLSPKQHHLWSVKGTQRDCSASEGSQTESLEADMLSWVKFSESNSDFLSGFADFSPHQLASFLLETVCSPKRFKTENHDILKDCMDQKTGDDTQAISLNGFLSTSVLTPPAPLSNFAPSNSTSPVLVQYENQLVSNKQSEDSYTHQKRGSRMSSTATECLGKCFSELPSLDAQDQQICTSLESPQLSLSQSALDLTHFRTTSNASEHQTLTVLPVLSRTFTSNSGVSVSPPLQEQEQLQHSLYSLHCMTAEHESLAPCHSSEVISLPRNPMVETDLNTGDCSASWSCVNFPCTESTTLDFLKEKSQDKHIETTSPISCDTTPSAGLGEADVSLCDFSQLVSQGEHPLTPSQSGSIPSNVASCYYIPLAQRTIFNPETQGSRMKRSTSGPSSSLNDFLEEGFQGEDGFWYKRPDVDDRCIQELCDLVELKKREENSKLFVEYEGGVSFPLGEGGRELLRACLNVKGCKGKSLQGASVPALLKLAYDWGLWNVAIRIKIERVTGELCPKHEAFVRFKAMQSHLRKYLKREQMHTERDGAGQITDIRFEEMKYLTLGKEGREKLRTQLRRLHDQNPCCMDALLGRYGFKYSELRNATVPQLLKMAHICCMWNEVIDACKNQEAKKDFRGARRLERSTVDPPSTYTSLVPKDFNQMFFSHVHPAFDSSHVPVTSASQPFLLHSPPKQQKAVANPQSPSFHEKNRAPLGNELKINQASPYSMDSTVSMSQCFSSKPLNVLELFPTAIALNVNMGKRSLII